MTSFNNGNQFNNTTTNGSNQNVQPSQSYSHNLSNINENNDKYRMKLIEIDENSYFHGIIKGQKLDGFGILFEKTGKFSVRGKFSNTVINGIGRVELENGEIYDGIFQNGKIQTGIFYTSLNNQFIYANFGGPTIDLLSRG